MTAGWALSPLPVVAAPMAGVSSPALVAAVSEAGGFGMLPSAYRSSERMASDIARTRQLTSRPFGVNVFLPAALDEAAQGEQVRRYADLLTPVAQSFDATVPEPRWDDTDSFAAKIDVLVRAALPVVSFVFGVPAGAVVDRLRAAGSQIMVTVTDPGEAAAAVRAGADLLCLQGAEAGGHRGTHAVAAEPDPRGWRELLPEVLALSSCPVVVAGGIMSAADVGDAGRRGAVAAQCGSAFVLTDEAATSAAYRAGFTDPALGDLVVTRAFSGRPARGVRNAFASRFGATAPPAFPVVDQLTKPLRAAATSAGNHQWINLWAGSGWRSARPGPAALVVAALGGVTGPTARD